MELLHQMVELEVQEVEVKEEIIMIRHLHKVEQLILVVVVVVVVRQHLIQALEEKV